MSAANGRFFFVYSNRVELGMDGRDGLGYEMNK
jgi:hypothetical protein